MHRTLTALISVLFHSSAHLLIWLKAAGCVLEGWLGIILHIFIAHFPCLLKAGWESVQDRKFMAQVATELF